MAQDLEPSSILGSGEPARTPKTKTTPENDARAAVLAMRAVRPKHRRVLRVEMDPENVGKALEIKAALAGVTRKTYCRVLARPDVQAAILAVSRRLLAPLAFRSAQLDGREGFADRKMLLAMAGVATEGSRKVEHSGSVTVKHGVGGALQRALLASREAHEAPAEPKVIAGPVIEAQAVEDEPESDTLTFEE